MSPATHPTKLARALDRGADALIADLEDAVPAAGKTSARADVVRWLATADPVRGQIWVRVNAGTARAADVTALAGKSSLTGLALAKLEDPAQVLDIAARLTAAGDETTVLMPS